MKKFIPLIVASLFACWSCELKDTYTQTNVRDMVTVKGDNLYNDFGYQLKIVEDAVGAAKWKVEDARYYAIYDILNRDLDIRLKEVLRAQILEAIPLENPEELAKDPVELTIEGISGGYINLGMSITRQRNSNFAHTIHFHYTVENNYLKMYVEHDGNGEDPVHMDSADLVSEELMFSIPMKDIPYFSSLGLVLNVVATEGGSSVIKEEIINLY